MSIPHLGKILISGGLALSLALGLLQEECRAQVGIRGASTGFTTGVVSGGSFGVKTSLGEGLSGLSQGETFKIGAGFWYADVEAKVPEAIELERGLPGEVPDQFDLDQNYPNPFNPVTSIVVSLPERSTARLEVYNMLGQLVSVLLEEELSAGRHRVQWDARDAAGRQVASGLYVYRLVAGDFSATRTMTLLK